jgi:flagellar hook-associated protein 2
MATDIIGALGAGSGFNSTQLVTDIVAAQRAPLQARIDTRTEQATAQLSAYGILKSSLAEFQNILTPLSDPDIFNAKAINVPTTDVVTFNSLTAQAQAGSYQLEVEQIASAQSIAFNSSQTDASQALGKTGDLTFKVGEWSSASGTPVFSANADTLGFTVNLTADDTLESIAGKINGNTDNTGVLASVITIDGKVQLLVTGESGSSNALEITASTTDLSEFEYNAASIAAQDPANPTAIETQSGQDAIFKLNGLEVTRGSNNISDVITGLDFTLNKADVGNNVSFSISQDKSTAETAIRGLVDAYNVLQETLKPLVGVSTDENNNLVRGNLSNDGTAKTLVNRISQAISSSVLGLDPSGGYSAFSSIGLRTAIDGSLSIDEEQFGIVLNRDFDKLSKLFAVDTSSESTFIELNTGSFASNAVPGEYTVDITQAPATGYLTGAVLDFTTPIDLSAAPVEFLLQVDGKSSDNIVLSGTYSTIEELTSDLQNSINSNPQFLGNNFSVDVTSEGGALKIASRSFGTSSTVEITSDLNSNLLASIGIDTSSVKVDGIDAKGTINGVEAFGSSNVLLPAIGSDAYGLNIAVKENTPLGEYKASFSRGIAGDLSLLVSSALADKGQIATREEGIEAERKVIATDLEGLDRKMSTYQDRLASQFQAMERIVASLNSTKSQLDGLIDRLPFTAKK